MVYYYAVYFCYFGGLGTHQSLFSPANMAFLNFKNGHEPSMYKYTLAAFTSRAKFNVQIKTGLWPKKPLF